MNTVVTDWCIVSVMEGKDHIGEVIWGTIVDDTTCRFATGEVVKSYWPRICSLASIFFSDSFGLKPALYLCGLV